MTERGNNFGATRPSDSVGAPTPSVKGGDLDTSLSASGD
jgi:hypothetical protein